MKNLVWYWNMVHYFLNKWEVVTQSIFNYPVLLLMRNDKVKEMYAKRGVQNPEEAVKHAVNSSKTGTNGIIAGIHMGGLLVMLELSIFNFIQVIAGKFLIQYFLKDAFSVMLLLIVFLVPAGVVNYFILFKDDKYLRYFNKFDKTLKGKNRKYGWISFFIVLSFWLITILSFVVLIKAL
jgi:hypothetical protein